MSKDWWWKLTPEEREVYNAKKRRAYWERRKKYGYNRKNGTKQTLCWSCQRAVKECPWSANFEPVPGWDAEETVLTTDTTSARSYHVKACPLYDPDP